MIVNYTIFLVPPSKQKYYAIRAYFVFILRQYIWIINTVANLIKHFMIVIYDSRVVLTTNLPILRL